MDGPLVVDLISIGSSGICIRGIGGGSRCIYARLNLSRATSLGPQQMCEGEDRGDTDLLGGPDPVAACIMHSHWNIGMLLAVTGCVTLSCEHIMTL